MQRKTVTAILQSVGAIRRSVDEVRRRLDVEALQVGDRSMIERALDTINGEFDVLERTFSDMLADPTKVE